MQDNIQKILQDSEYANSPATLTFTRLEFQALQILSNWRNQPLQHQPAADLQLIQQFLQQCQGNMKCHERIHEQLCSAYPILSPWVGHFMTRYIWVTRHIAACKEAHKSWSMARQAHYTVPMPYDQFTLCLSLVDLFEGFNWLERHGVFHDHKELSNLHQIITDCHQWKRDSERIKPTARHKESGIKDPDTTRNFSRLYSDEFQLDFFRLTTPEEQDALKSLYGNDWNDQLNKRLYRIMRQNHDKVNMPKHHPED